MSDLEQRIRLSKFALLQAVVLNLLWLGYFVWIGNADCTNAILLTSAAYLPAILLHAIHWDYLARIYWMVATAIAFLMITIFYGNGITPEAFFFFLASFPFLLFSWSEERKTLIGVVALQVAIGFVALSLDFFGIEKGMPDPPLSEAQVLTVEWGIRINVAFLLLVQMVFFSILNHHARIQANQALQRANTAARTKGEFLANMSHEIRTPMNGVIGMIEVLETMDLNRQQARSVSTIRNSAFALLRILDDILDASQIEAGKLNVEKTKTELRPLLEGVSQTLQNMADERGCQLRLMIDQSLPEWVWTDSGRLRQVLLNLISNAIKYSDRTLTGRTGMVMLNAVNRQDGTLLITVKDNGIGMSEEVQQRLFEPFTQGEQSSRRRVGGTGLGLVITKNIVNLMGGDIRIESTEGEGSKAIVELPLEPADGRSRMADLAGLQVFCIGEWDEMMYYGLDNMLGSGGVRNTFLADWEDVLRQDPERINRATVIFPPMAEEERLRLQQQFEDRFPAASFIHCSPVRSEKFGFLSENTYRIQIFPMMSSELFHVLAVLSGRKERDDIHPGNSVADIGPGPDPGESRVLIIEDNEINRAVLSKQLEILGYPHELASDGMEGFRKWEQGDFDLLLTDCHMPRMDGFEMVAAIRAEEQRGGLPPVPIIAITANALDGEAEKCLATGMNAYLAKPVELQALKAQMTRLLAATGKP